MFITRHAHENAVWEMLWWILLLSLAAVLSLLASSAAG